MSIGGLYAVEKFQSIFSKNRDLSESQQAKAGKGSLFSRKFSDFLFFSSSFFFQFAFI